MSSHRSTRTNERACYSTSADISRIKKEEELEKSIETGERISKDHPTLYVYYINRFRNITSTLQSVLSLSFSSAFIFLSLSLTFIKNEIRVVL